MIEETYITFETAKLAKEKGLDPIYIDRYIYKENSEEMFFSCTQSLLQRWLREEYNVHITIDNYYRNTKGYKPEYCVYINGSQHGYQGNSDGGVYLFRTYELALEEALLQALKLIK